MAENVSSNVLFHFTKSMDDLKSILKHGFFPHYCPEYTLDPIDVEAARKRCPPMHAAPMVCFCDLPMSLIGKHLEEYGNFGIGLNKEWGVENGVAPVIYTHPKTQTRLLSSLTARAVKGNGKTEANALKVLAAYTKPFVGPAWRNNDVERKVMFYDEREWRYVPVLQGVEPLFLDWKDYDNSAKRNRLHNRFKKQNALPIHPDFIQYLILPYESDENNVLELHDYVMKLYGRRYTRKDAVLVTTTIMTDNCIKEDI